MLCFLEKDSQSQECHLVLIEKFFHCSGSHDSTCHVIICAAVCGSAKNCTSSNGRLAMAQNTSQSP